MLRRLRIPVQWICLLLFFYLLLRTLGTGRDHLGPPVRIFLEIDPLVGLSTWIRTHALHGLLALSLLTLALTFLLGRFFCGWICPLGTLSQITTRLLRRRREERAQDSYRSSQRWKYLILAFVLTASAGGVLWVGILDPMSLLIRSLTVGFAPPVELIVRGIAATLARSPLGSISEPSYQWLHDHVMNPSPPRFEQGFLLATILMLLLSLSWLRSRFFCRVLCPLGGLLGTVAWAGTLRLRQNPDTCTDCTICSFHCQGAADPDRMNGWRPAECLVCGNCTASCNQNGLAFTFTRPRLFNIAFPSRDRQDTRDPATLPLGVGRRRLLLGMGLGLLSGPLARAVPARRRPAASLIRPPGAGEEDRFLDRCVRCGECMKVCPGNGLHPAGLEAGLASLWTPVLRPRIGYCEYHCTLCGQVCPTGALPRLSFIEKERAVLGLAYIEFSRCLPYAFATACIVCEEHCPTSPKAIILDDVRVRALDGTTRAMRQPRVVPDRCVGCGICEYRCPVEGDAAVRIFATGRTGQGGPFDLGPVERP